jgi:hypothetical protein
MVHRKKEPLRILKAIVDQMVQEMEGMQDRMIMFQVARRNQGLRFKARMELGN